MKFAFYSLGCKANQCETAALEHQCVSIGHTIVPFDEKADIYIINTCAVTATGCKKSRSIVHNARRSAPDGVIAVCGCYSQMQPQELLENGADIVFGTSEKGQVIPKAIEFFQNKMQPQTFVDTEISKEFENLSGSLFERTRAYLKIEDGCNNFCTYCIIPYARGRVRSPSRQFVLSELEKLQKHGYKEVVLTGIEISSYGSDTGDNLADLLEELCTKAKDVRFRLGSLEPRTITEDFCKRLSVFPNLCNHFHLSLQSGCDQTLKRMGRKYDTQRFFQSVQLLNQYFNDCAITTDLIVGFPGETEQEFQSTLEFIKKCKFADMHIFQYSKREGTVAAKMDEQLRNSVKEIRSKQAIQCADQMKNDFLSSMIGKDMEVLFEQQQENNNWVGYSKNYCKIETESQENLRNIIGKVRLVSQNGELLFGENNER